MNVRKMCRLALMTALICIAAPLSVPIGPIPISLATLTVYLAGALLGPVDGVIAVALYILLGAVGLPVFSGFGAGIAKLIGVTGGYIIGYLPCAALTGAGAKFWGDRKWVYPVAMVVGTIACYVLGTAWFMVQTGTGLAASMSSCVLPFLPGDAIKIVIASVLAVILRERVKLFAI